MRKYSILLRKSQVAASMNLDPLECRLLAAAELNATSTAAELSERTGLRSHVVRYRLRSMAKRNIIGKPQPFINFQRLGYVECYFYFSFDGTSTADAQRMLIDMLLESPRVSWLLRTGGPFQYATGICLPSIHDLFVLLNDITEKAENTLYKKSIAIRTAYTRLSRNYLSDEAPHSRDALSYRADQPQIALSNAERCVLGAMAGDLCHTLREISESTGLPIATVERHKKSLEQKGVIMGYFYRVSSERFGMQNVRLMLNMRGISNTTKQQLYEYAKQSRWINNIQEWIGRWDYLLSAEIRELKDVTQITDELYHSFGSSIVEITTLTIYEFLKTSQHVFAEQGEELA